MTDNAVVTDLDARYGRRPPMARRRRTALALAGVAAGVLAVVAFYFWWADHQDPFAASVTAFAVHSDSAVEIRVDVVNRGDGAVRCEIVALDQGHQVVGSGIVEAPAGQRDTVVVTVLPTTARAVAATVHDCADATPRVP